MTEEPVKTTGWRKFTLACFASVSSVVLAWIHVLAGPEWVAAQSFILGLYGAANVVDKKNGGAG